MADEIIMAATGTPSEVSQEMESTIGGLFDDAPEEAGGTGKPEVEDTPPGASEVPAAPPVALAPIEDEDPLAPPKDLPGAEPAAPVVEPEPAEEPEPEAIKTQPKSARDAFAKSRKETQAARKQARELQLQLASEQAKAKQALDELQLVKTQAPKELEQVVFLQKRLEEMEEKVGQYDVTQTSTFKAEYDIPFAEEMGLGVQALVTGTGRDAKQAQQLMAKLAAPGITPEEINGILSDEPHHVQAAVFQQTMKMKTIRDRRAQAIKEWRSTKAAHQDKSGRINEAQSAGEIVAATDAAAVQLFKEGNPLYMKSPTDAKWNAAVEQRTRIVQGLLRSPKIADLAKYVADGVSSREFRLAHGKLREENMKLKREIADLTGTAPKVRPSAGSDSRSAPPKPPAGGMDIEDGMDKMFSDAPKVW